MTLKPLADFGNRVADKAREEFQPVLTIWFQAAVSKPTSRNNVPESERHTRQDSARNLLPWGWGPKP
jgi:hypothetical protein